jgi:SSS family solute:Na+ symporter
MVVAYMVVTSLIGVLLAKRKQNSKEYFIAESSLGVIAVIALLFSEIIAGAGTIGNAQTAFLSGISSVWANWGMALGCFAFTVLCSKFYRSMGTERGAMSVPEAYSLLFDERCRVVMIFTVVLAYLMMFSTQATAAAAIVSPLFGDGANQTVVTWIVAAVFIIITCFGGRKGIANMNVVHAVFMYIGMGLVAFMAIRSVGGFGTLRASVDRTFFSVAQPNVQTVLGQAIGTAISFFASSNVACGCFSAKSYKTANRGIALAGLIVIPFALFPALIGVCAHVAMPGIKSTDALFEMARSLGPALTGFASMAIIAAIWSTGPSLLLVICTSLTRDLFKRFLKKDATDGQQLAFSRAMAVIIGIVGTYFGISAKSILGQMLGAFQIRSVVGIVLLVALNWPRVTKNAAFWSMLIGGVVAAVWFFTGNPMGLQPLWPAAIVCLVVLVPMTLASKEPVSPGYKMYKECAAAMLGKSGSPDTPAAEVVDAGPQVNDA